MIYYRVFDGHKTVTDPASRGAVPADVRKCPLKVPVWSAERHLLYCLVQYQVLQIKSYHNLIITSLKTKIIVKLLSLKSIHNVG